MWLIGAACLAVLLFAVAYLSGWFGGTAPTAPAAPHAGASAPDRQRATAAVVPPVNASQTFRIDLTQGCGFGAKGDALFDRLVSHRDDGTAQTVPAVMLGGASLPTALGRSRTDADQIQDTGRATVPASARLIWSGLRPRGIYASSAYGGEYRDRGLVLDAAPVAVRAALRAQHIDVPLPPGVREVTSEVNENLHLAQTGTGTM